MENKEIQELCNQIKDKLNELGFTEFTLYAADYYGGFDDDDLIEQIEEKVPDTASSLGWYFKVNDDYSGYSSVHTYARKIKIKGDELVFDLEDIYEDNDGGWGVKGEHEDQTISEILDKCPEEMVMSGLKNILHYAFNCDTYDVIGSNRL